MKKKIFTFILVTMLLISLLCSCGSASMGDASDNYYPSDKSDVEADYGYSGGYNKSDVDMSAEDMASGSTGSNAGNYAEKIIKNVSISAQTKEYEKALKGILNALNGYGGYEESVESTGTGYNKDAYYTRHAYLKLRIPQERLSDFLFDIGELINVTSQNSYQSNVTSQYYDLVARNQVLEAERIAYEEMLKKAENVDELLMIKDRLYKTIEEIEANKTQLKIYDNKVSYSTVTINLSEVKEYISTPTPKTSFGTRIANSFKESWRDFGNGCQDFAVWFVGALPALLIIGVIIGVGCTVGFKIAKSSKKTKKENDTDGK